LWKTWASDSPSKPAFLAEVVATAAADMILFFEWVGWVLGKSAVSRAGTCGGEEVFSGRTRKKKREGGPCVLVPG